MLSDQSDVVKSASNESSEMQGQVSLETVVLFLICFGSQGVYPPKEE